MSLRDRSYHRLELETGTCKIDDMHDTTDFRRIWRISWLNCIREFADVELQRRQWLDPDNSSPHWSYVEFMCSYFDDTLYGHDYAWAISEGLVTAEEVAAVALLHRLLEQHEAPAGEAYNNLAVLNDPAWLAIVKEAGRARGRLNVLVSDPAEKDILGGGT